MSALDDLTFPQYQRLLPDDMIDRRVEPNVAALREARRMASDSRLVFFLHPGHRTWVVGRVQGPTWDLAFVEVVVVCKNPATGAVPFPPTPWHVQQYLSRSVVAYGSNAAVSAAQRALAEKQKTTAAAAHDDADRAFVEEHEVPALNRLAAQTHGSRNIPIGDAERGIRAFEDAAMAVGAPTLAHSGVTLHRGRGQKAAARRADLRLLRGSG